MDEWEYSDWANKNMYWKLIDKWREQELGDASEERDAIMREVRQAKLYLAQLQAKIKEAEKKLDNLDWVLGTEEQKDA